jgi:hypothetical protein
MSQRRHKKRYLAQRRKDAEKENETTRNPEQCPYLPLRLCASAPLRQCASFFQQSLCASLSFAVSQ